MISAEEEEEDKKKQQEDKPELKFSMICKWSHELT